MVWINVRVLASSLRAINYYDIDKKLSLDTPGLFWKSWWDAIWGDYPILYEDLPEDEIEIILLYEYPYNETYFTSDKQLKVRFYAHTLYPSMIGLMELIIFSYAFSIPNYQIIAWFTGIKTVAQWRGWSNDRAKYNAFIVGTLLNVFGAYFLANIWTQC